LDYAMSLPQDYAVAGSLRESVNRIRQLLVRSSPQVLASFDDFFASVNLDANTWTKEGYFRNSPTRKWIGSSALPHLSDVIPNFIPKNCLIDFDYQRGLQSGLWKQIVIRHSDQKICRYIYDRRLIAELFRDPNQSSMLLIHEWLRDFYRDPGSSFKIRNANAFLHSKEAEAVSPETFNKRVFRGSIKN
jgi:hypothetical protein